MDHTETHLKNVALKHMPPNLQKVDLLRAGKQSRLFQIKIRTIMYIPDISTYLRVSSSVSVEK